MSFLAPLITFLGIDSGLALAVALSESVLIPAPSEESAGDSFMMGDGPGPFQRSNLPGLARDLHKQFGNADAVIGLLNTRGFLSNRVAAAFQKNLEAKPRISDVIVERLRQIVVNAEVAGEKKILLPKGAQELYLHRYIEEAGWRVINRPGCFAIITKEEATFSPSRR